MSLLCLNFRQQKLDSKQGVFDWQLNPPGGLQLGLCLVSLNLKKSLQFRIKVEFSKFREDSIVSHNGVSPKCANGAHSRNQHSR